MSGDLRYEKAESALRHCIGSDFKTARVSLEAMTIEELKALRRGLVLLENEVVCAVEELGKPELER
jgi:hypothetical protein